MLSMLKIRGIVVMVLVVASMLQQMRIIVDIGPCNII
jgi:hypothetical protein